ncbi:MAG: hypothetical protein HON14_12765 [Rhodospirillaceae bacterium]|jgi:hypothetical protein|nr:hypothetical protein [Rhodospirillaceae bacterium]MBT4939999.1 hypothetical protein [Rhodospirillaceae bacterium]MBT5940263.1 hypothetical protein [Rhodospirillaceae bacterium]MBT7267159.1 hypothetical protein [Rhodospirillaceae bacterium]
MSDYNFYAGYLRFAAQKTERETPEIEEMMAELDRVAGALEAGDNFFVAADKLRVTGRALAGVAGFLQQHILPEVIAADNDKGEAQIRWVIDTSMSLMANLMAHAETTKDSEGYQVSLPDAP